MINYIGELARPMRRHNAVLPQLLGALAMRLRNWRRRRRDQNALMRQPEYLLRDIGIERRDLERALRGRPYY